MECLESKWNGEREQIWHGMRDKRNINEWIGDGESETVRKLPREEQRGK